MSLLGSSTLEDYAAHNIPFESVETFSQPAGPPAITMNAPFSAAGAFTANPSVDAQYPTTTPYTEEYNLTVEHELGQSLAVRVSYVGQHNIHEVNESGGNIIPDINQPVPAPGPEQPRRFVQPWSTIGLTFDPIFHSTMNALQVGVHKQYGSGLMINAEYQYSRVLGTESFLNPMTVADSYGNIGGITPQVLEASYSYLLPFGQGQLLFSNAGNIATKLIGGWQISGITAYEGGQPFSVSFTATLQGAQNGRADRVPGLNLYPAHKTLGEWFNTAAFTVPVPYTFGNSAYDMLWGPRYQDWDLSLEKNTVWRKNFILNFAWIPLTPSITLTLALRMPVLTVHLT